MPHTLPAANIAEAIRFTQQNVQEVHESGAASLVLDLNTWIQTVFPLFSDDDENQRQILLWAKPTQIASSRIPSNAPSGSTEQNVSEVSFAVWSLLHATLGAFNRGEIDAALRDAVVAAFNASWI